MDTMALFEAVFLIGLRVSYIYVLTSRLIRSTPYIPILMSSPTKERTKYKIPDRR